ncbi:MAG: hypothetical protein LW687_12080 [Burkholderiaceae bacterium]|jgi:hypothetical protein|nr:hypothetical protein [Burkholderiaceae bacterium]MCE2925911.1 hypothetical protein [Phycisphaeraceae bacterium]
MKKNAKEGTAGERHIARWTSQTVREVRLDPNSRKEANQIDCLQKRAANAGVLKERERCVRILWRWHKSAQSARTPLGRDVFEHLEAIIKEVGNPDKYQ